MEAAGRAATEAARARWSMWPMAVPCGSGNNGGGGFVAARHLSAGVGRYGSRFWAPSKIRPETLRITADLWQGAAERSRRRNAANAARCADHLRARRWSRSACAVDLALLAGSYPDPTKSEGVEQ